MKPLFFLLFVTGHLAAKSIAYIYGDVAADGTIPSGPSTAPYDQMLLTDSGSKGISQFKTLVEAQGYTISQHYDQTTTLDAPFLNQFDVILFGLHQKVWSAAEQSALDTWLQDGGGILMYSDSAAGGHFGTAPGGINNPTGQMAVNSILSNYGMQVAVDQGGGTRAYYPDPDSPNPIIWDQPVFEGEGVSPIAIDPNGSATALIPLDAAHHTNNGTLNINPVGITISNPQWAVLAHATVSKGNVLAIFDRQPLWNGGPGSDINQQDNKEVLRRIVRFLARDYGNSPGWLQFGFIAGTAPDLQVSYRQWSDGSGQTGYDYISRNNRFSLQQQAGLAPEGWRSESALCELLSTNPFGDGESEIVTLRLLPDDNSPTWFARLAVAPDLPPLIPTASANGDRLVPLSGSAWLEGAVSNSSGQSWSKLSGPGTVTFADPTSSQTTATFSQTGSYQLQLTASTPDSSATATHTVEVINSSDILAAINCGGPAYAGNNGITYSADQFFNGGGVDDFPGNAVLNTNDDTLYNTARSKDSFTGYSIPAANGNYLVLLQLAETYWTTPNKRVFDLSIEDNLLLDDLDLYSAAGTWVTYDQSFPTTVSDSSLDIAVSASINNPLVNAIVVIAQP